MNPVIQEEKSGCGIATVAALVGATYNETQGIANSLGIYAEDRALWSDTKYVRRLLTHYGRTASEGETEFTSWDSLPALALLAIKWRLIDGKAHWHWVLFVRDFEGSPVVLDPKKALKSNVRRDFWRMKPKWFIAISDKRN